MPKKSLSKKVKKPVAPQYSLTERKEAREIAIKDLTNSLKKLEAGKSLRFGELGTFKKTKHQVKLKNNQLFPDVNGKAYLYYRINFRASSHLKRELDK